MCFKKDEKSKYDFLSWKAFFSLLFLMFFSLILFILIIPYILEQIFPRYASLLSSVHFRTLLSFPSLFLNYYLIYYFVCKRRNKTLKEGFFFIPVSKEIYLKSLAVGILMPILSSPILISMAPKDFHALDMSKDPVGLVFLIVGAILAPFLEEVFYRGFLFPFFQSKINSFFAVALTSLLFGFSHYMNVGNAEILVVLFIAYGLVLSLARYLTGSLIPPVIIHMCHNVTLIICFLIGKQFNLIN
jgi:membrane protease YdiL (CAAX protease family)